LKKTTDCGADPNTFHGMDDLLADEVRDCDTDDDPTDYDHTDDDDTADDRDRGRALLDAAEQHLLHHQPERAVALWQQLINEGGEYADDASVEYAGHLFRHSRGEGARAVLHKVMTKGRTDSLAWLKAGLLLEAHGHLVDALIWYSLATDGLTAYEVSNSRWPKVMVTSRRRVKCALGMELDSIDELGEVGEVEDTDKYFDLLDLFRKPSVLRGAVQVWSREEFAEARRRWPWRISTDSIDRYYREVEGVLREYDERVTIFHRTVKFFVDRVDELERRLSEPHPTAAPLAPDDNPGVPWPPERNQPCWCESGRKYKRCCGLGDPAGSRQAWGPEGLRAGAQLAVGRV
jgi:hypothetical protein